MFTAALMVCLAVFQAENTCRKPTGLMTDLLAHTDSVWSGRRAEIFSEHPSMSWIVPGKGMQRAFRILVASSRENAEAGIGDIWDSGKVRSRESSSVRCEGPALLPSKEYFWRVKTWTERGSGEAGGGKKRRQGTADGVRGKSRRKCGTLRTEQASAWSDVKAFRTAERLEEYGTAYYPLAKDAEKPVSVSKTGTGWLVDFGKDAFGQLELELYSKDGGDTVLVGMGEQLQNGRLLRNPTTTVRYQRHSLILEKGTRTYRVSIAPDKRNTGPQAIRMPEYAGEVMPFRWCEVEGYARPLEKAACTRWTVHYPFDDHAAAFRCSDTILNRIWELCHHSVKATSFTGIYIDGDRERIPYEADALINQLCHYAADREYSMARRSLEHLLRHPTWPTEWILQSVTIAWNDYLATGNDRLLRQHYELLKAHSLRALREKNGLISTRTGLQTPQFQASIRFPGQIRDIVDWPQQVPETDGIPGGSDGFVFTDYNAVVNAWYYRTLRLMARIAEVVGNEEDAKSFTQEADAFPALFNDAFSDAGTGLYRDGIGTNHSALHTNLFALLFGLVPEARRKTVTGFIVSKKISCGVYAAQFLLEALYDAGEAEAALKLMTSVSTAGWYNMIRSGATITMEAWDDTFKPNQDWNHIWGAAPGNIIPFKLMGVTPLEPGFSRVRIQPRTASLEYAELTLPTIKGDLFLRVENGTRLILDIPANMEAEVHFAGRCPVLSPGRHIIS